MSNQFLPIAYAFTNTGVFDSNDGLNFITGLDANDNIVTVTAGQLGDRIIVYPNYIFIGNNTINATINSTMYTGVSTSNGVTVNPGGSNTAVQFNDSGVFGGNSQFTFNKLTGNLAVNSITVNAILTSVFSSGNSTANTYINSSGFYLNGIQVGSGSNGVYASAALGQLPGTTTNDSANAGNIGETIVQSFSTSVSSSATATNLGTVSIPSAGHWEISAVCNWNGGGATNSTDYTAIISTTSTPSTSAGNAIDGHLKRFRVPANLDWAILMTWPGYRLSTTGPTTVYLHGVAVYTTTPVPTGSGWLKATRIR